MSFCAAHFSYTHAECLWHYRNFNWETSNHFTIDLDKKRFGGIRTNGFDSMKLHPRMRIDFTVIEQRQASEQLQGWQKLYHRHIEEAVIDCRTRTGQHPAALIVPIAYGDIRNFRINRF